MGTVPTKVGTYTQYSHPNTDNSHPALTDKYPVLTSDHGPRATDLVSVICSSDPTEPQEMSQQNQILSHIKLPKQGFLHKCSNQSYG